MDELSTIQTDTAEDGFNAGIEYCKQSTDFLHVGILSDGNKEMLTSMYNTCLRIEREGK